jgi:hypothetical protein
MFNWGQIWTIQRPTEWDLIFQQDNARPHVARVCQDFLANHNINPLDWHPYSPDLSPNRTSVGRNRPINSSISRMPSSRICYSPDSPVHGVHQSIYPSHGDIIPLFQQGILNWSRVAWAFRRPLTIGGVLLNWFQLLMNYWLKSNEILKTCWLNLCFYSYILILTSVTSLILLCMEFIRAFILLMGILSHSSNKAALNWSRVAVAFRCLLKKTFE